VRRLWRLAGKAEKENGDGLHAIGSSGLGSSGSMFLTVLSKSKESFLLQGGRPAFAKSPLSPLYKGEDVQRLSPFGKGGARGIFAYCFAYELRNS
jgi:hypothetical protein